MKTSYRSFEEIEYDLKTYRLQREIALEDLKYTKHELQEDLMPNQWVSTALSFIKKYGIYYMVRKVLK